MTSSLCCIVVALRSIGCSRRFFTSPGLEAPLGSNLEESPYKFRLVENKLFIRRFKIAMAIQGHIYVVMLVTSYKSCCMVRLKIQNAQFKGFNDLYPVQCMIVNCIEFINL